MKKILSAAVALVAMAGATTASAENLPVTIDENSYEYGLRGYVEYQASGNAYPNFYVLFSNFNSTKPEAAADGEKVVERINLVMETTGPEGFTSTKTMNMNPAFPTAEQHTYCHLGILDNSGTYNFTMTMTINFVDTEKDPLVETLTGSFVIPTQEVDPAVPTLSYTIVPTESGANFEYSIDLGTNSPDDVESVLVALLRGGEAFNEEALYHSTKLKDTIVCDFSANNLGIWFKAQVTMKDGKVYQLKPWDQAMTLTKDIKTSLTYTLTVGEFTRTGDTSGTLPYKIECNGDLSLVDHWIVWASRAGDENMNVTDTWDLEGVLNLDVLPANASTPIWPKVQAVWKEGGRGDVVQTSTTVSTVSASTPVITITAGATEPTGSTTGTVEYTINVLSNEDQVEKYVIYVVRAGEIEVGRLETTETTGKIVLTELPENATTELWMKAYAIDKAGNETQVVQYPGEAQGWTGLSITTVGTGVDAVDAADESAPVFFNLQGVKIANPEAGKIYIKVVNGKASKVLVK